MIRATVVGEVWATRKAPGLAGRKLLLLAAEDEDRLVVAIDMLDARRSDGVLVSWGSGARNVLEPGPGNRQILADAALSQVIDDRSDPTEESG